jgi:hypothetical protein
MNYYVDSCLDLVGYLTSSITPLKITLTVTRDCTFTVNLSLMHASYVVTNAFFTVAAIMKNSTGMKYTSNTVAGVGEYIIRVGQCEADSLCLSHSYNINAMQSTYYVNHDKAITIFLHFRTKTPKQGCKTSQELLPSREKWRTVHQ